EEEEEEEGEMEEDEEEGEEERTNTRSTRKGKALERKDLPKTIQPTRWHIKGTSIVDADEEKRNKSGGRKGADEESEEEDKKTKKKRILPRSGGKRRKSGDGEVEEEKEELARESKRTASTRRGRNAIENDDDEEEEEEPTSSHSKRGTRKNKKRMEREKEDEEEEEARPAKNKRVATRSTRKEKEGVEESEEKGKGKESTKNKGESRGEAIVENDAGEIGETSTSRARRRIVYDAKEEQEGRGETKEKKKRGRPRKEKEQELIPLESPQKEAEKEGEEKKKTRTARRAIREDEVHEQPQAINETGLDEEMDVGSNEEGDDEIKEEKTKGISESYDGLKKEDIKACEEVVKTIRNSLKSVFISKDERAFRSAVVNVSKAKTKAYKGANYNAPSLAFYDEIEYQLNNMMTKASGETKNEVEGKKRVLQVIAKALITDFNDLADDLYDAYWSQIEYLLNKFATAEDSHVRSFFCYWVSNLLYYSKLVYSEEKAQHSQQEMERKYGERVDDENSQEDRRMLDEEMLKLRERRRLYLGLYQSLKHDDSIVRISAISGLSILQDEPIPPAFTEAVTHSPKDLIMRQLMDVHVNVRKAAIEELRPTTDQQIEFLMRAAMQEKHDNIRKDAFIKLGRLKIEQFNLAQRHSLLGMIRDNILGPTIEGYVLFPWLYEMVNGENPNPILKRSMIDELEVKKEGGRKKANNAATKVKWTSAPFQLLRFLDCVNHGDDVLHALRKASAIAKKESGNGLFSVGTFMADVIDQCDKEGLGLITMTEYRHLLDRGVSDEARAAILTFWLHSLQFVHENKKDAGELYDGVQQLSPSMGDLRKLIQDLLEDERERLAPRKKLKEKKEIDVTHPAFVPSSPQLQSVVTMVLRAFKYLPQGDNDTMNEWKELLMGLTTGDQCDISLPMWEVIMHDLLKYHTNEAEKDDLVYEVAARMGFDFDGIIALADDEDDGKGGNKTPKRRSLKGMAEVSSTPTSSLGRKEGEEKMREDRRLLLSRPHYLGMIHGALKTANFDSRAEALAIVFKAEMDVYRSLTDNGLRALALECFGMFCRDSSDLVYKMASRYIEFVLDSLLQSPPQVDEGTMEEEAEKVDEMKTRKRKKKIDRAVLDELETEYGRREKAERERREVERRGKRGSINHTRGLCLAVLSDLIVSQSLPKIHDLMKESVHMFKVHDLCLLMEKMVLDQDLELVFMVAHCTFKLCLFDRDVMKHMGKIASLLMFKSMHPSSFAHSRLRSCVLSFFPQYGAKSNLHQMLLAEVVVGMLAMIKERSADHKNIIDRGMNSYSAISYVCIASAPSSLKLKDLSSSTAHSVLLQKLGDFLVKCEEDAREDIRVDADYYKAVLGAIYGMEFSGMPAANLRMIYTILQNNMDLLSQWDRGGELKKMTVDLIKRIGNDLDCLNEIARLNKALGIKVREEEERMPIEREATEKIKELLENLKETGRDIREISPVDDGRPLRVGMWTPLNKKRGREEEMKRLMSSLKKEPARSKSYAATAAAERKEKEAATAQTSPVRPSTRNLRKRGPRMSTIDESD
ncbi:hypothetical protein PMAYCL1PPCAC_28895, partial [Pristionchus mayeri]